MELYRGEKGKSFRVVGMRLPIETERRLEVLGMLEGTQVQIVNRKKKGAMVIKVRGTRFAVGDRITRNIEVEPV